MRFHVRMGVQASNSRRPHVGPIPLLGGILGTVALGVVAALVIAVAGVHLITAPAERPITGGSAPTPAERPVAPGTYTAGTLKAPAALGDLPRLSSLDRSQAGLLRSERDALATATGKPTIAAAYGKPAPLQLLPVDLVASSGYLDPNQYLGTVGSGKVTFSTVGADQCATDAGVAIVCARADQQKQLTVAVEGTQPYLTSASAAASLTDSAFKALGG